MLPLPLKMAETYTLCGQQPVTELLHVQNFQSDPILWACGEKAWPFLTLPRLPNQMQRLIKASKLYEQGVRLWL